MIQIVVLQRGWVVVGVVTRKKKQLEIEMAHVVRRWGTTKGIGELAKCGPLEGTTLDPCHGTVRVHELTVVLTIDCDQVVWHGKLS